MVARSTCSYFSVPKNRSKAWPVVRHDGDRSGCFTDHVVVGVDDVHHAAVGTEVVEVEDPFGSTTAGGGNRAHPGRETSG